jgi:transcriptional regulator with GAF, ATPase, and Fis domain
VTDLDTGAGRERPLEQFIETVPPATPAEPLPTLGDFTRLLLATGTVEGVLRRVVATARHAIPNADLVSITLRHDDGTLETPTGTGREAIELDQAQYRAENGPCVDAADPEGPAYARSNDLAGETPWPAFAASAVAHGYTSVLSTALLSGSEPTPFTGALNIYSRRPEGFDDNARDLAFLLATHASLALVTAQTRQTLAEAADTAAHLRHALESRTLIGQATGILMARRKLSADQAFDVLSRASQNRNIKLSRLAALLADEPETVDQL